MTGTVKQKDKGRTVMKNDKTLDKREMGSTLSAENNMFSALRDVYGIKDAAGRLFYRIMSNSEDEEEDSAEKGTYSINDKALCNTFAYKIHKIDIQSKIDIEILRENCLFCRKALKEDIDFYRDIEKNIKEVFTEQTIWSDYLFLLGLLILADEKDIENAERLSKVSDKYFSGKEIFGKIREIDDSISDLKNQKNAGLASAYWFSTTVRDKWDDTVTVVLSQDRIDDYKQTCFNCEKKKREFEKYEDLIDEYNELETDTFDYFSDGRAFREIALRFMKEMCRRMYKEKYGPSAIDSFIEELRKERNFRTREIRMLIDK